MGKKHTQLNPKQKKRERVKEAKRTLWNAMNLHAEICEGLSPELVQFLVFHMRNLKQTGKVSMLSARPHSGIQSEGCLEEVGMGEKHPWQNYLSVFRSE